MKELFVACSGKTLLIDDRDVGIYMAGVPWGECKGYLTGRINKRTTKLHLAIAKAMGLTDCVVDHHDRNKYNVQRSNLKRSCPIQNGRNLSISTKNTSGIAGVSWHKNINKWTARLGSKHLGYFANIEDAVTVREKAIIERDAAPLNTKLGLQIRRVILNHTPRELMLTCGKMVLVCEDDYIPCLRYKWGYCKRNNYIHATANKSILLHRFIAEMAGMLGNVGADMVVDHEHGNIFDCRREKLRLITLKENGQNQKSNGGISLDTSRQKWRGQIMIDGITYRTKWFIYKHDAQEAFDELLKEVNPQFRRVEE